MLYLVDYIVVDLKKDTIQIFHNTYNIPLIFAVSLTIYLNEWLEDDFDLVMSSYDDLIKIECNYKKNSDGCLE